MFLYCKEPFIQLRKLLNFEVENPADFLRLDLLFLKYVLGMTPLNEKNQHRKLYFQRKYILLHVLTFSALRHTSKTPRAIDGARGI